jgi:TPR repeat protein
LRRHWPVIALSSCIVVLLATIFYFSWTKESKSGPYEYYISGDYKRSFTTLSQKEPLKAYDNYLLASMYHSGAYDGSYVPQRQKTLENLEAAKKGNIGEAFLLHGDILREEAGLTGDPSAYRAAYQKAKDQINKIELTNRSATENAALGDLYVSPERMGTVYGQAERYYRLAANKGYTYAMCQLGKLLEPGSGFEGSDPKKALKWYQRAAESGDPEGYYLLGKAYEHGIGTKPDEAQALKYYQEAAEYNYPEALFRLSLCHLNGELGAKNSGTKVEKYLKQASLQNIAGAQYYLALCYEEGVFSEGKDMKKALSNMKKAADNEYVKAYYELFKYYYEGVNDITPDTDQAMKFLRKGAEAGDPDCQYTLGKFYRDSEGPIPGENTERALKYYKLAANQGIANAQNGLGVIYEERKDYDEALKWYRKAALNDQKYAQYNLAKMFQKGLGLSKPNRDSAVHWYKEAYARDVGEARDSLERLDAL